MKRLAGPGYGQVISAALDVIPTHLHRLIRPDYFCGADPVFAGLHPFTDTDDVRSYRRIAHVANPHHQTHGTRPSRVTTVVLPTVPDLDALVHELGHVLDETLGFTHHAEPVTWYARTDRYEAFAEAFTSWLLPGYAARPDPATLATLDALAA